MKTLITRDLVRTFDPCDAFHPETIPSCGIYACDARPLLEALRWHDAVWILSRVLTHEQRLIWAEAAVQRCALLYGGNYSIEARGYLGRVRSCSALSHQNYRSTCFTGYAVETVVYAAQPHGDQSREMSTLITHGIELLS